MKILGVFFGNVNVEQDNWQPKLNKLEKSLSLWRFRSLSLLGKSLIINVLGFSKFTYLARVLPMPSWVLTSINALVWPFLWGSKMETVARNTCFLKPCQGELGIVNLKVKACALRSVGLLSALADPADSCFFVCRYFVATSISSLRTEWRHLRSNSLPNASSPTIFYSECIDTLVKVSDAELNSRAIYYKLLAIESSPPLLPRQWAHMIGPRFSIDRHWSRVRDAFTENYKNDILWLITLRGTKVRDSLFNWGCISSPICASCNRRETIDHCFLRG